MARDFGIIQKKILLLLLGGAALGLSGSPRRYFKILKEIKKEWGNIDSQKLHRTIRSLYYSKLIKEVENDDGSITLVLSEKGRQRALKYKLSDMRGFIKRMGFRELQKSVFIVPYECLDEVEYLCEYFEIGKYLRYIIAEHIDNENYLKKSFQL
jgi:DNA-binding transcriptional regulator PaaX